MVAVAVGLTVGDVVAVGCAVAVADAVATGAGVNVSVGAGVAVAVAVGVGWGAEPLPAQPARHRTTARVATTPCDPTAGIRMSPPDSRSDATTGPRTKSISPGRTHRRGRNGRKGTAVNTVARR